MIQRATRLHLTLAVTALVGCGGTAHRIGGDDDPTQDGTGGTTADDAGIGGSGGASGGGTGEGGAVGGGTAVAGWTGAGGGTAVAGWTGAGGGTAVGGTAGWSGTGGAIGGGTAVGGWPGSGGATAAGGTSGWAGAGGAVGGGTAVGGATGTAGATGLVYGGASYYEGYVENYHFASGSDALALYAAGAGGMPSVGGWMRFGAQPVAMGGQGGTASVGQLDADALYPAGVAGGSGVEGVVEGFDYSLRSATLVDSRLQLDIVTTEPWRDWCASHQPIAASTPGQYGCLPDGFAYGKDAGGCWISVDGGASQPIGCGTVTLCSTLCECDATACRESSSHTVHLDTVVRPGTVDGSVVGLESSIHNVHLTER